MQHFKELTSIIPLLTLFGFSVTFMKVIVNAINANENVMHTYVKPVLKKLDTAHDLTYGKVESELRGALEKPLGTATARVVASVVVQAIEFLAPI